MRVNAVQISENKFNNSRTVFTEAIGKEIHKLRKERSMTGKELARLVNVSQQQISRYECGVCNLTIDTLIIILNALDVPLTDFFNQVFMRVFETEKKVCVQYHNVFSSIDQSEELKKQLETFGRYNKSNLWG
ncbi:helix-turn-helix domain-containing protein [Providencia manganoxydans]|uniref:Helix-turn-helix transcriptional regulator n=2 Tax=Providencia TaxID=586 RepID=A0AAI9GGB5_PROST|nr:MULTISPECIES: helix-turn-helix transcriptional regulator [Providencia]MDV5227786.1 helix-turn-helix transcriptional regulator [Providencia rettgeri]ELR5038400.1 helix-turn-helix transcriptional regulator [Providencia stuartii]ELR5081706.1 helix-turn-helix transcriptional regulator [Providencia stuartii]ELR5113503.1 helix-turn-helix transcriptional regulator [Providencia stuartii]MDX4945566.1 helix-turn-helix transcriptional regulator [Providencia manganoxydans]